jgi:hypothetical protein
MNKPGGSNSWKYEDQKGIAGTYYTAVRNKNQPIKDNEFELTYLCTLYGQESFYKYILNLSGSLVVAGYHCPTTP